MKTKHTLWLLVLISGPLSAEAPQIIEGFYDQDNAFVIQEDGAFVPAKELGLIPPFRITGQENGQYRFKGSDGKEYRVYIPEVIKAQSKKPIVYCDDSQQVVVKDDHRSASARGVSKECD